jgi:hypothetical protein
MARAREDNRGDFFQILGRVATIASKSKRLIKKMENCGADCEPEELTTAATALEQKQLRMQESIKLITNELASCLDSPMIKQLSTALQECDDYSKLIKKMPEDSPMHAICRLYIIGAELIESNESLMDRAEENELTLAKKAQANARQAEEPDAGAQDGGEQEVAGDYTADDYFNDD